MQALSLAVGPAGLNYFAQQLVAHHLAQTLAGVTPPDRSLPVADFEHFDSGSSFSYSNIQITLSNGSVVGFHPAFDAFNQTKEQFALALTATAFTANYHWHESYDYTYEHNGNSYGPSPDVGDYGFSTSIGSLTATLPLGFEYDKPSNTYRFTMVGAPAVNTAGETANVPADSIIQGEDQGCFTSHLDDATLSALKAIDFTTPIGSLFGSVLESIAASGKLTQDTTYDFAVGDAGLTFPDGEGLAIGITGTVKYNTETFPGTPPAGLPVPPPPADEHHLQLYVSSYEMDALYWAFWKAGDLNATVQAGDLQDPDILKCRTYENSIRAFKPYAANTMEARIVPKSAPTTSFQKVWVVTHAALTLLQPQLPSDVYTLVDELQGNAYVALTDLQADLASIDPKWYAAIESATAAAGMVMTHDLEFVLTIQTAGAPQPNVVFDLARTDILQNLGLGRTGAAQTLTFGFVHVGYDATFVSSTVPNFAREEGAAFGISVWPVVGEPYYDEAVADVGKAGSPLPMMSGFSFRFADASVSIQEGYVSILAQVTGAGS